MLSRAFDTVLARTRRQPPWIRYAGSAGLVGLAGLGRVFLVEELVPAIGLPFLSFLPAVLLAAALFDLGGGLFATVLSGLIVAFGYLNPVGSMGVQQPHQLAALVLFLLNGVAISLVLETLHAALQRLGRSEQLRTLQLREFRHRTRNDLASLVSLLQLRARGIKLPEARAALLEASAHAMALARVHTRLTAAGDDAITIDTREFLGGLCSDLITAQLPNGLQPIRITAHLQPWPLDTERAVQLGLVLNETVTNAMKYAFPDGRAGQIEVRFIRQKDDFVLRVQDDGVGIPEASIAGLGTRLLQALAAQLRGSFQRLPHTEGGTLTELRFPVQEGPSRPGPKSCRGAVILPRQQLA